MSDFVEQAKNNAADNFKQGLNCAESVFKAILDTGVAPDFLPETVALATGFGGGMGLTGNNWGALIGAVMAVGAVHGRKNPLEGTSHNASIGSMGIPACTGSLTG